MHPLCRGAELPLCASTLAGEGLQETTELSFVVLGEADDAEAEGVPEELFSLVSLVLVSLVLVSLVVDLESSVLLGLAPFLP